MAKTLEHNKSRSYHRILKRTIYLIMMVTGIQVNAQNTNGFWVPKDTFNQGRFYTALASGAILYTGAMIGLDQAWYQEYPKTKLHSYNDWREWRNMDKFGHWYTAYFESRLLYQGAKWTGLKEEKALWLGTGLGFFLQGSIEWLDGHSAQWGWSWSDVLFNGLGCSSFFIQQRYWKDQKITFKVSSWKRSYPSDQILSVDGIGSSSLQERAQSLYGHSFAERFLKDYNAQSIWASFNIKAFMPESSFPDWLNIAFGVGAENLFAGYGYSWNDEQNNTYRLPSHDYPRTSQFFLSPDIDFTRIKTKSHFLRSVFQVLNVFKVPAPALEINSQGKWKLHLMLINK